MNIGLTQDVRIKMRRAYRRKIIMAAVCTHLQGRTLVLQNSSHLFARVLISIYPAVRSFGYRHQFDKTVIQDAFRIEVKVPGKFTNVPV